MPRSVHLLHTQGFLQKTLTSFLVRVRVTLRLAIYRQLVRLCVKPFETHGQNFFQLNTRCHSPYVTPSLTREWGCRLQLLLVLTRAFVLRFESRRTLNHILLSQIWDFPNLEPRSPYLYFSSTGWSSYTPPPGIGFPFRHLWWLAGLTFSKRVAKVLVNLDTSTFVAMEISSKTVWDLDKGTTSKYETKNTTHRFEFERPPVKAFLLRNQT
jgi:hypothetical protein